MEDVGRKESEKKLRRKKLRGRGAAKYLDSEKEEFEEEYLEVFASDEAGEAAHEKKVMMIGKNLKASNFATKTAPATLEPQMLELIKLARRGMPVGERNPQLTQKILKEREVIADLVETGSRAVISKTHGILREEEAKKVMEIDEGDLIDVDMPRQSTADAKDMEEKLRTIKKGVKKLTEVMN